MQQYIKNYSEKLSRALGLSAMDEIPELGQALRESWKHGRTIYLCGNGGSWSWLNQVELWFASKAMT